MTYIETKSGIRIYFDTNDSYFKCYINRKEHGSESIKYIYSVIEDYNTLLLNKESFDKPLSVVGLYNPNEELLVDKIINGDSYFNDELVVWGSLSDNYVVVDDNSEKYVKETKELLQKQIEINKKLKTLEKTLSKYSLKSYCNNLK